MKNKYGQLPKVIGNREVKVDEMMFYQDMPIKLKRYTVTSYEKRLDVFGKIILDIIQSYIKEFGMEDYLNTYVYVSAKNLFQPVDKPFNRPGWHCDGYMSNDITYVWSDNNGTIFNHSDFKLTAHHEKSIIEMEEQALPENCVQYPDNSIIRLDQYNVHKVAEVKKAGMRAFLKVSFSKDKFDLLGNTHNYMLDYNWEMKPRNSNRNVPQSESKGY